MYEYQDATIQNDQNDHITLLNELKKKLPRVMREQLTQQTKARGYFLLAMLSNDDDVHRLRELLQKQYKAHPCSQTSIEQALSLVNQLQESRCNHRAPFKYRLPKFIGEYPIHSSKINSMINRFNQLIESYHSNQWIKELDAKALNQCYQELLAEIKNHYLGCNINSLWQLLRAMSAWSTSPIETFFPLYPYLLTSEITDKPAQRNSIKLSQEPINPLDQSISSNKQANAQPFTTTFDYQINEAGRIADKSIYLSIHGFALKPGGHADALAKKIPDFLPWAQWKCNIRRQLSQLIDLPLNDEFFDWLQIVLQRLGVEFIILKHSSYDCYVSPFLNHQIILNTLNEEMIFGILKEQGEQADVTINDANLTILSRYLIRFLQGFQFNRGQALGIGANWGGVVSDSNEAGVDVFRFNDSEWASQFRNLSLHRQGPAEAHMNASIGIKYEIEALLSSFEYMTQLQPSEYSDTLYNALVDNLIATLFPEPPYFENKTYSKYRRHHVVKYTDDGMQKIDSFYQPDSQGTYFKTNKNEYKQTPMFRQAGSLQVEAFPRDTGSGDCFQSLSVANPLWPLQLQYAQSNATGIRGHLVYNPIGPDEFIPDTFYGQLIRETDTIYVPFIGVIPKNFDKHFMQVELCASFVIRMLQSSRLITYCPAFNGFYLAIAARFLPAMENKTPPLPGFVTIEINRKWQELDKRLHNPQRTAESCHKAFFSLFKELVYSLYSLTKEELDLHYYFTELTATPNAFEPRNRATCERFIRELTTLKPLQNKTNLQKYDIILHYLSEITAFFYPTPCDETAKAVAQQARLHVKPLLALKEIKQYFADLCQNGASANISTKVSPGLMHNALMYQAPSPAVYRDFYKQRHGINFHSGYRDLDGSQIVKPSTRETWLDISIKTIGALLPLIHRNKTILSLITQPLSMAYILGYQKYCTQEQNKLFNAICFSIGGFIYGAGLGIYNAMSSIPRTIYTSFFAPTIQQHKANHALAISSAPSNEPGVRVKAIMEIRDHLLLLMASANGLTPSIDQLINLLVTHVNTINPSLLSDQLSKEKQYKKILLNAFPLEQSEWQQLFEPVIDVRNSKELQHIINQYALQIDSVLVYAVYECLTSPKCEQSKNEIIKVIIDKHKLKDPQDKALTTLVHYYVNNPEVKKLDIAQFSFQGTALATLRTKERGLRKIQIWLHNALDIQWGLEALVHCYLDKYQFLLNESTLSDIVLDFPDNMKEVLHELLSNLGNEKHILKQYQLDNSIKDFLIHCTICYKKISSTHEKEIILNRIRVYKNQDSSLSIKAREHLKLIQFVGREWHHQLLPMESVQAIINEIKKQMDLSYHPEIDELLSLYEKALQNPNGANALDQFYFAALKLQKKCTVSNPLNEWVNVTMNGFMNLILDKITWNPENKIMNQLNKSWALEQWLNHLLTHRHGIRNLLAQQIEQATSFDQAAWRCQHILAALEGESQEHIHNTGMQKLLRIICQNKNTLTTTGEQKAKAVPISTLCKYSITMQHALDRVRKKIPNADLVRPIDVTLKGF